VTAVSRHGPRRGPGRRPRGADTRGQILAAARSSFAARGYDATTLRGIAREVGVDPALVHHYFDGKEQLFVAAMELPFDPAVAVPAMLAGDDDLIGERFVRFFLMLWGDPVKREPFLALLRSAVSHQEAASMLREFVTAAILERAVALIDLPDARLRVEAAAAQMIGLAMVRYIVQAEPIASASDDQLVALLAPTIQCYLSGQPAPM
jgi:AcrR family transcriptional regulator